LAVTGNVTATSFTGSLLGTASFATTASFALNAGGGGAAFPFTGSALITGSLGVTGSVTISNSITASTLLVSGSGVQRAIIYGSGSSQPIFSVLGSQGELFSVTDSLSGSLFSVNDISGLPILEVFSDDTVLMGDSIAPVLNTTKRVSLTGSMTIYSMPTASYDGMFVEYTIRSGSNGRMGQFMSMWSGSSTINSDISTVDFGTTAGVAFTTIVSGSNMVMTGSASSGTWTSKFIIRTI
jgi:hypothetical protein